MDNILATCTYSGKVEVSGQFYVGDSRLSTWPMDGINCPVRLEMLCYMDSWMMYDLGKEPDMSGAEIYKDLCLAIHNDQMNDNSSLLKIRST